MGRPHLTADERAIEESAEVLVASGWAGPHEHERLYLLDRLSACRAELAAVRVATDEVAALRRALSAAERDAQQAEAALADGIRAEDAAMALGAERERAAVVADLMAEAEALAARANGWEAHEFAGNQKYAARVLRDFASRYESGAHIAAPEVPDPAGPFRISQHLTAPIVKAPPKPRDLDADGLRTPSGYVRIEAAVYVGPDRVVVAAWPDAEDERHDCDAMGCGQEHIAATIARADWYGPVPDGVAAPEVPDAA